MKQLKAVIVGYGDRGRQYGRYATLHPDQLKIVAVVDPSDMNRNQAKINFGIPEERCYKTEAEFLTVPRIADCAINCTMDELHIKTTLPLLEAGYDVMLEKPVTSDPAQLMMLEKTAKRLGRKVVVCHVLRYTPFYQSIKQVLLDGKIGDIVNAELAEYVGIPHVLTSYIRGKWRNSEVCGSSFLLAKSCHDLDLLCWLNAPATPVTVSSFGARTIFTPEHAPEGAGTVCTKDCPIERNCIYSAKKMYLEHNTMGFLVWANMDTYFTDVTEEQKKQHLLTSDFGKCAYRLDGNIYDHQVVSVFFDNGSTANFSLVANATHPGRTLHIVGTRGEIEGFFEGNRYTVRTFNSETLCYDETNYDVTCEDMSGHMGGDLRLVEDFVHVESGEDFSISTTILDDSVIGHLCVYAADRSAGEGRIVHLSEFETE